MEIAKPLYVKIIQIHIEEALISLFMINRTLSFPLYTDKSQFHSKNHDEDTLLAYPINSWIITSTVYQAIAFMVQTLGILQTFW